MHNIFLEHTRQVTYVDSLKMLETKATKTYYREYTNFYTFYEKKVHPKYIHTYIQTHPHTYT